MTKLHNKTLKFFGGDITARPSFKHILSIGYEFETANLSKFTHTEITEVENALFNSDTARKDIDEFKSVDFAEDEDDEDMLNRLEEVVELPAFSSNGKEDPNVLFYITNDIAVNPFIKKLYNECIEFEEIPKNELYSFRTLDKTRKYPIQFIFHEDRDCSIFSNVEWLFTYLQPTTTNNIIIKTLSNAVFNLLKHLEDLEKIKGHLLLTQHGKELIINNPVERILFKKPGKNLYYLQTQYLRKNAGRGNDVDRELTVNDICCTVQMTFSSHISNVFAIMKSIMLDTTNSIAVNHSIFEEGYAFVVNVEKCAKELFKRFYTSAIPCKNAKAINKEQKHALLNYVGLILYKLFTYFNDYLTTEKSNRKYFKNHLSFNARHSNYVLYQNLKKILADVLLIDVGDERLAKYIQELFVQESILSTYINKSVLRRGALDIKNELSMNSSSYGNPAFSLVSYFQFFEKPVQQAADIKVHDWLEYKNIDAYSAKMDLNDHVVLVECRNFQRLLSTYMYSIPNDEIKRGMKKGICNELKNVYDESIGGVSIGNLKNMISKGVKRNTRRSIA